MDHHLFCKPAAQTPAGQILYSKRMEAPEATISFRSLSLSTDLDMIFDWVNKAYSKRFWQLAGSKKLVLNTYQEILENPATHSFIGLLGETPVCQIDVYLLIVDELWKEVLDGKSNDCGFHLLMTPPKTSRRGLSEKMLRAFFDFYFSFPDAERLFGEPDKDNALANRLALAAGMEFLYKVQLSYKEANLYSITKQQFHETQPHH